MTELAVETDNQPFNTDTLTEDYDIGARLARCSMKQIFGTFPVEYRIQRKGLFGFGKDKVTMLRMPLGIREYFPNTFHTAYRQKARWTLGIGLQGWEHGLLAIPRMVIGNFINMMAAARAWRLFLVHLVTGRRLVWDKTMHDFPSTDQLMQQPRHLGELLLLWQVIDETKFSFALAV